MERTVVIFDVDSRRAQALCDAIERCENDVRISVRKAADKATLSRLVRHEEVDVFFLDVHALEIGWSSERIHKKGKGHESVQVVYTGVTEGHLVQLGLTDYAFLLPNDADDEAIALALRKSLELRDKALELPLVVMTRKCHRAIHPSHISFIESDLRKIRIYVGTEVVEVYGKLSRIIHKLPKRFVQCHKSFVVNMGFVETLNREHLVLTTGECVPVSQKRRKTTREAFHEYVGRSV